MLPARFLHNCMHPFRAVTGLTKRYKEMATELAARRKQAQQMALKTENLESLLAGKGGMIKGMWIVVKLYCCYFYCFCFCNEN